MSNLSRCWCDAFLCAKYLMSWCVNWDQIEVDITLGHDEYILKRVKTWLDFGDLALIFKVTAELKRSHFEMCGGVIGYIRFSMVRVEIKMNKFWLDSLSLFHNICLFFTEITI